MIMRGENSGRRGTTEDSRGWAQSNSTTFFFSNFPDDYGEMDMFKVFQKWARVKEVFISRRPNKWGRRFGFVRFFQIRNEGRLEKDLDQMYIGNRKLYVNTPKYRRQQFEDLRGVRRNPRAMGVENLKDNGKRHMEVSGHKGKQTRTEMWVESKGNLSYLDVARGDQKQQRMSPGFTTQQKTPPWLCKSVVGKLSDGFDEEYLGDELVKGGLNMIRVRKLGDRLHLITPREGENMDNIIKDHKEWFDEVFVSIEPWSVLSASNHRVVWVRCYGVPLSYWSRDCFEKVLGVMATSAVLVSIDKNTLSWEVVEYARLQVRILNLDSTKMARSVWINNICYSVLMEEENQVQYSDGCKVHGALDESSDSVSSSETYVEETELSVKNGEEVDRCWGGGKCRSKEEERGGEVRGEDEQYIQKSKVLYMGSPSKRVESQGKGDKGITFEGRRQQYGHEGTDFTLISDQICGAAHSSWPTHHEVAKMVVEVECKINQEVMTTGLGQGRVMSMAHLGGEWPLKAAQSEKDGGGFIQQTAQRIHVTGSEIESMVYESPVRVLEVGGSVESKRAPSGKETNSLGEQVKRIGANPKRWEGNGIPLLCFLKGGSEEGPDEGVVKPGVDVPKVQEEGKCNERSKSNSPPRRREKKSLAELGEPSSHPRRSVRISERVSR